ncbi:MAG: hypothetical protein ACLPKB_18095 [Xanthobacteraceae bacterium]
MDSRTYKLATQSTGRGGRTENANWFYFAGGYIKLLAVVRAIWVGPLYQAPTPDASRLCCVPIPQILK